MPHSWSLLLNPVCHYTAFLFIEFLDLSDVNAMEVVGSKSSIALGTFPLPIVIAGLQALITEDMETLCKHSLLIPGITTGATQLSLRTNNLQLIKINCQSKYK